MSTSQEIDVGKLTDDQLSKFVETGELEEKKPTETPPPVVEKAESKPEPVPESKDVSKPPTGQILDDEDDDDSPLEVAGENFESLEKATEAHKALKERLAKAERAAIRAKRQARDLRNQNEALTGVMTRVGGAAPSSVPAPEDTSPQAAILRKYGIEPPASTPRRSEERQAIALKQDPATGKYVLSSEDLGKVVAAHVEAIQKPQIEALQAAQGRQKMLQDLIKDIPMDVQDRLRDAYREMDGKFLEAVKASGKTPRNVPEILSFLDDEGISDEIRSRYPGVEIEDLIDVGLGAADPYNNGRHLVRAAKKYTQLWSKKSEEGTPRKSEVKPGTSLKELPPDKPRSLNKKGQEAGIDKDDPISVFLDMPYKELMALPDDKREALVARAMKKMEEINA